jgi:curli production assembly/transport component CsgF
MRFLLALFCGALGCAAEASELVYTPINPSFGGSPLNGSTLLSEASAQKPNAPTTTSSQQSTAEQFLQMLQSQLYASLANSVATAITGQSCATVCSMNLGTMTVSWGTSSCSSGSGMCTNITMNSGGQITQISIPQSIQ